MRHERRQDERRRGVIDEAYAAWRAGEAGARGCANCHGEGWVCENHASMGWPSVCECGAGAPCPNCNPNSPPFARALHALEAIQSCLDGYNGAPLGFAGVPGDVAQTLYWIARRGLLRASEVGRAASSGGSDDG